MQVLIRILHNITEHTFHPIIYREAQLPGPMDSEINRNVVRFKSKGHHTDGFPSLEEAQASINDEFIRQLETGMLMTKLIQEVEVPDVWDGCDIPVDVQTRMR